MRKFGSARLANHGRAWIAGDRFFLVEEGSYQDRVPDKSLLSEPVESVAHEE